MRLFKHIAEHAEWYRDQGIAAKTLEAPGRDEPTLVAQAHAVVKADKAERDPAAEEREAKLELWMEEVKAFIRNIDVSKL